MPFPKPRFSHRHLPHRLRRLIGTWAVAGRFVGGPEVIAVRGTTTFRWLVKDALVVMRTRMKLAPASTAVLGADDTHNAFTMLYSDGWRAIDPREVGEVGRRAAVAARL